MSRTHPTEVERVELRYPCPRCGARPGEWCQRYASADHALLSFLHESRWRIATENGALPL